MFLFKKHICAGSPLENHWSKQHINERTHSLHTPEEQDAINIKEALCIFLSDYAYAAMYTMIQCVMCESSGASEKERERERGRENSQRET